jgi:hypothetical protein
MKEPKLFRFFDELLTELKTQKIYFFTLNNKLQERIQNIFNSDKSLQEFDIRVAYKELFELRRKYLIITDFLSDSLKESLSKNNAINYKITYYANSIEYIAQDIILLNLMYGNNDPEISFTHENILLTY